jgi:23S rRNA pseudouridine1911/1915/1917 synthase
MPAGPLQAVPGGGERARSRTFDPKRNAAGRFFSKGPLSCRLGDVNVKGTETLKESDEAMSARKKVKTIVVPKEDSGRRIDRYLGALLYPEYSRSYLTGMIVSGQILVDGKRVRKSYRVAEGESIAIELDVRNPSTPLAEDIPLDIIHEEEHYLVINKPAGLVVHPGTGEKSGTLVNALLHHYPEIARVGVIYRPGVVHRLDRETTGLILVARTNLARYHLVEEFKNRRVDKEYLAVVVGNIPFHSDYIDLPLGKDPRNPERVRVDRAYGKPASSFYEVIENFDGFCAVKVNIHTGRTHQIRVHMNHIGFPLVADPVYGKGKRQIFKAVVEDLAAAGKPVPAISRQALHARRVAFLHPITKEKVVFEAPLPQDLEGLLDWLRRERKAETDEGMEPL